MLNLTSTESNLAIMKSAIMKGKKATSTFAKPEFTFTNVSPLEGTAKQTIEFSTKDAGLKAKGVK
jgi:hypothetical protein